MNRPERLRVGVLSGEPSRSDAYADILATWSGVDVRVCGVSAGTRGGDENDECDRLFQWRPHAVIVTAGHASRRRLVERAAAAGANVLCEPPLAPTRADAEAMLAACERASVTLTMAHPVRFSPALRRLRELTEAGSLGVLVAATGTGATPLSADAPLVDSIVHVLDLLEWLTGLRAVQVHAVTNQILRAEHEHHRAETGGLVTISYESGLIATVDCSCSQGAGAQNALTLDVIGTRGIAAVAPFAQQVGGYSDGRVLQLPYGADLDRLMLARFLLASRSGTQSGSQPQPDGAAGLRVLSIIHAARESARTGQPVALSGEKENP